MQQLEMPSTLLQAAAGAEKEELHVAGKSTGAAAAGVVLQQRQQQPPQLQTAEGRLVLSRRMMPKAGS
jgi:hypothetical protein